MNPGKKAAYYTLGCKLNFSETSTIARQLAEAGFARVEFHERPDLFVINTCSVTEHANRKCRNVVNRALKINAEAFVVVIGCYAQLKPDEIAAIPGVDVVLGAAEKFEIETYLGEKKLECGEFHTREIKQTRDFVPSYSAGDRTRSFLKVQDGCNYFCAFCTIPLARGRSRSANIADTLLEARNVVETGVKEIVLTGVNIGDFGTAHNEDFLGLIQELDKIERLQRTRISSIEPNLLSNDIIDFVANSTSFMPHFHIPLQSGSDVILKRMRRRYLSGLYSDRVARIKNAMPHACIGVDVITGFPGETDEEFLKTYEFLQALPVSYLHVFTYSERPNTTALRIEEVVPMPVRQERSKMLRILSNKKKRAFYSEFSGETRKALIEGDNHDGWMHGFTDNYIKVRLPFDEKLINQLVEVELGDITFDLEMNASIKTLVTP